VQKFDPQKMDVNDLVLPNELKKYHKYTQVMLGQLPLVTDLGDINEGHAEHTRIFKRN
jgi:hypothetical protein